MPAKIIKSMAESVNSTVWNLVKLAWNRLTARPEEIVWAAVFAFIIWMIADPWGGDSRIRALIRHIKNKLSEQSAARLRKRIAELQKAREVITFYLTSDKALYLAQFRMVMVVLLLICVGAALGLLGQLVRSPDFGMLGISVYGFAVILVLFGIQFSLLDTRQKVAELLAKRDEEIADLQRKLEAMTK
ncbi:MAG: hypothetical protein WAK24_04735 [Candidatus Acidiferrales bacterium]